MFPGFVLAFLWLPLVSSKLLHGEQSNANQQEEKDSRDRAQGIQRKGGYLTANSFDSDCL